MGSFDERPGLAFLFSLAASVGFAAMGAFVASLQGSLGPPETVLFRGVVGGLLGLVAHVVLRKPISVQAPRILVVRTIAGTLSLFCYYGTIAGIASGGKGSLATASLLLKTAPVWVALGAGFLLGERATGRTWFALVMGIVGAVIATLQPREGAVEGIALGGNEALGLMAGIFAAGAYLSVRRLAASEDPLTVVTLFSFGIALLMLPVVLIRNAWHVPSLREFGLLLGVAISGTTAQYLMTHAYRHSKAAIVAVSGLTEVAFSVTLSILVFHEQPRAATLFGGGLAVFAGMIASWPKR